MELEQVILVNEQDQSVGSCEKMAAHEQGLLHRAFSVFVFNSRGRLLLQQRAVGKYHSGGLWTNTCCSHPRPGESTEDAAYRRLQEEMGFQTELFHAFTFTYTAGLDKGLVENEIDHVFTGIYDGEILPNQEEVMDHSYISIIQLEESIEQFPEKFTIWLRIAFPRIKFWWLDQFEHSVALAG
ncbi:MAG: isopentenyl-diphosphate Delta-isomerase [Bacteroidetes bacterium]|nr:isopentenyl-diphosphate Delta-isomerase [Bacteroidota bacterium]